MATIKTLPKTEDGHGVLYRTPTTEYVISQNTIKAKFTLWRIVEDEYEKLGTADSPIELYKKIEKLEKSS